jgi:Tfp pilus assembly protein PilF
VRVGEWKYIAAPRPELYDLRVDPGEQKNLIQDRAMVAGRLAAELRRLGPPAGEAARRETQPDPEAVRRLQALGYVGAFAPVTATTATVDPKDRVVEYQEYRRLFNQALTALHRNRPAEAVPLFKQILTANVRAFEAHLYLGNAYAALGQHEAALGEYDAVRMLNPDLATVEFEAAKVLAMRGETTAAVERARVGLAREPHSFYGQYTLGVIHQMAKQPGEAAEAFTRAVALNAQEPRARWNLAQAAMALGRAALAEEQLEQVIALGYRVAQAEDNLGVIAARAGDRAEAARRFQRALDADPKFDPARKALAGLK